LKGQVVTLLGAALVRKLLVTRRSDFPKIREGVLALSADKQRESCRRIAQRDVVFIVLIGASSSDPNQLILEQDVLVVVIRRQGVLVECDEQLVAAIWHLRGKADIEVSSSPGVVVDAEQPVHVCPGVAPV
jgi:hypothetical protein